MQEDVLSVANPRGVRRARPRLRRWRLARLVLALLYVGARRLEHRRYLAGDPLIARFCGLARIPTARTVAQRGNDSCRSASSKHSKSPACASAGLLVLGLCRRVARAYTLRPRAARGAV